MNPSDELFSDSEDEAIILKSKPITRVKESAEEALLEFLAPEPVEKDLKSESEIIVRAKGGTELLSIDPLEITVQMDDLD